MTARDRYLRGLRRRARRAIWWDRHPDASLYLMDGLSTILIVGIVWLGLR